MEYSNNKQELIGKKFGRLIITKILLEKDKDTYPLCECCCECGNVIIARINNIKSGNTRSCGCYKKEKIIEASRTHGLSKSSVYRAWNHMKNRCYNRKIKDYVEYGGRGIIVCSEWKNSFEQFYEDMGESPSKSHSLDRIDTNGPYAKWNCRWATPRQQSNNTRRNHILTHNGKSMTIAGWSRELDIKQETISMRVRRGYSVEKALYKGILPKKGSKN